MNMRVYFFSLALFLLCFATIFVAPALTRIVVGIDGKPLPPGTYNKTGIINSCEWSKHRCMISDQTLLLAPDVQLYTDADTVASSSIFSEGTEVRFYFNKGKITNMWKIKDANPNLIKGNQTTGDVRNTPRQTDDNDVKLDVNGIWRN